MKKMNKVMKMQYEGFVKLKLALSNSITLWSQNAFVLERCLAEGYPDVIIKDFSKNVDMCDMQSRLLYDKICRFHDCYNFDKSDVDLLWNRTLKNLALCGVVRDKFLASDN